VRMAVAADLDFMVACNRQMAAETEDLGLVEATLRQGIEYLLNHPDEGFYVVAEKHNTRIGTLMVTYEWSDWRNGRFWWIQSVYVMPDQRRTGVYRAMHEFVRTLAQRDTQICGLRLYVERNNTVAQQTYQHIGMSETHYRIYEEALTPHD
jgi:GNAT superfamily N-acetyltransferase